MAKKPLPVSCSSNPTTLGGYIRQERIKRGLLQKDLAILFSVHVMTITNWENETKKIMTRYFPSIVEFLGFVPDVLSDFTPLKSEVFVYRCRHGITQEEMALILGIDKGTLHAIEWRTRKTSIQLQRIFDEILSE